MQKDDGSGPYDDPQWASPLSSLGARKYPYLYKSTTKPAVGAQIELSAAADPAKKYYVRAVNTSLAVAFEDAEASISSDDKVLILNGTTLEGLGFPAGKTYYEENFVILFYLKIGEDGKYNLVGGSVNPIYACLADPLAEGFPTPYRTVVHLACSEKGAATQSAAMLKTWSIFSKSKPEAGKMKEGPKNVMAWNEIAQNWSRPLYYYEAGTIFEKNGETLAKLIGPPNDGVWGSGRCGAWAELLVSALKINGVAAQQTGISLIPGLGITYFWVNKWNHYNSSKDFAFMKNYNEMQPGPALGDYGAMSDINGAPGSNSPKPSQKSWFDHAIVKYDGLYYDPSYGLIYSDAADFQSTCIFCFGTEKFVSPTGRLHCSVFKTNVLSIQFSN